MVTKPLHFCIDLDFRLVLYLSSSFSENIKQVLLCAGRFWKSLQWSVFISETIENLLDLMEVDLVRKLIFLFT